MSYSSYDFYKTHYFFEIEMKEKIIQKSSIVISAFSALLIANASMFTNILNILMSHNLVSKKCSLEVFLLFLYIILFIFVGLLLFYFYNCFYNIIKTIYINKEYEYLNELSNLYSFEKEYLVLNNNNEELVKKENENYIIEQYSNASTTNSKHNISRHTYFIKSFKNLLYIVIISFFFFLLNIVVFIMDKL